MLLGGFGAVTGGDRVAFFKKKKAEPSFSEPLRGPVEWIIVGLGNPGKEYEYTRHNAGFLFLDVFCNMKQCRIDRLKFRALCGETMLGDHHCLLMRPQTFMNLSGDAVGAAASFYKIPPERVLVVFDDISLPFGTLRIRRKGSAGGHNGIKSIIYQLGSDQFPRIKIGVGDRADRSEELKDYVLGKFSKTELDELKKELETAVSAAEQIVNGQIDQAMNLYSK